MMPKSAPLATTITTATAATATLFALQHHADAAIIYSGAQNITASDAATTAGIAARTVTMAFGAGFNLTVNRMLNSAVKRASVNFEAFDGAFLLNGSNQLKRLALGDAISAGKFPGHSGTIGKLAVIRQGVMQTGTWPVAQTGFVGFELKVSNPTSAVYFGWVRLEWTSTTNQPYPSDLTAIDYAYDNTPGEAIQAGQGIPAPEPGTVALLALAGAGAAFLRRRRQVGAN